MDRVEIKKRAREFASHNKWNFWKPVVILGIIGFIVGIIVGIFGEESVVGSIISILFEIAIIPYTFGMYAYYLKLVRGKDFSTDDLKKYYPMFVRLFLIDLLAGIFIMLWSILLVIPGIIAAISYSMIYFIAVDDESLSSSEVLKKSKEMMNGHKWEYFVFQLSFIGWEILCTLTCGILLIWIFPYMTAANVMYYEELKKLN